MVGALPAEVKETRQTLRIRLARTRRKRGEISGLSEHFIDFRGMHLLSQDHLPRELLERD